MNIFILGMPGSGRTTVANAVCSINGGKYISATDWIRTSFADENPDHNVHSEVYHAWLSDAIKRRPDMIGNYLFQSIEDNSCYNQHFVIDGVFSPKDFVQLFDYNKDVALFLNRINNDVPYQDYENIGVSVIKDYCFWLSSAGCLDKNRWIEYNFQIPGFDSKVIRSLGAKNSVYMTKSLNKAIEHIKMLFVANKMDIGIIP